MPTLGDSALAKLSERIQPWLEPVSAQAPTGKLARHEPAYEAVFSEVARLESPTGEPVRWGEVVQGAGELLRTTTKDLWIAAYLAYGLYATEGLAGAAAGAALLTELCERYWEGLFPEARRMRSRALAVTWYVEHLARTLPSAYTATSGHEQVQALLEATEKLSEVVRTRLENQGPGMGPLLTSVRRIHASLPELPPASATAPTPAAPAQPAPPPPAPAQPAAPPPAPTAAAQPTPPPAPVAPAAAAAPAPAPKPAALLPAAPTAQLGSAEGATDFLRNVGNTLVEAAAVVRRADGTSGLAYRLLRTGLWLHISQLPPVGANGRTSVPPLPQSLRDKLQQLTANARWAELLEEAEGSMGQYRFALDLQRHSAHALAQLGPTYAAAREALVQELAAMLRRLPAVVELVAADGSPLADEATRTWLRQEVLTPAAKSPAPRPVALALPTTPTLSDTASLSEDPEVRELFAAGRTEEALARLQATVASATTGRVRFTARLALARACANAGQLALAHTLYEVLDAECTERGLDLWEPTLAAACLEGFIATAQPQENSTGSMAPSLRKRYRRLVQLDPSAALRVRL